LAYCRCDLDFPLPALVSNLIKINKSTAGVIFAVVAYCWWAAITPLYFKWLATVPLVELVVWRILSGLPILLCILLLKKQLISCYKSLANKKTAFLLLGSTIFIAINWVVFVLAVVWDRVTEASLGYYINPLVTLALGFLILKERIRPIQIVAVLIALIAVVYLTIEQGALPWISLSLAGTFAMYGLLRKIMPVGSMEGLTIEMTFAFPICLALQFWAISSSDTIFYQFNGMQMFGLAIGGFVTIVPLLFFTGGAKRLQLSTMGILQYIAPTGQLLLAVLLFKEPFEQTQLIVFILIWIAVVLYSIDSIRFDKLRNNAQ